MDPPHEPPQLELATIVSLPFEENTYIARLAGRWDCLVIDPGLEPRKILNYLDRHGLTPSALLITHGHGDHIGGNQALKERWPECPLVIGRGDVPKLSDAWLNMSAPFGVEVLSPPADVTLSEGDVYGAAGFELQVREIPGHSSGHVVYIWHAGRPIRVFGGDVLFAGSVGRTDLPGGDFRQLSEGIRSKLFTLPDDTIVLPGHGPSTTIGTEKRTNPFVGGR
jgi:glyoxylase-like metal-dependent hydrolase (beta-lactamase superfamily II)